ncbi:MAG: energy-coupling factor transporter ATPase [Methanosarcinaceae archaeon]|jgi:energy-coupling factor transport system ATP-binding protein|nr:energy-coupling factor transporter ATPase [Methanosarcinaceae archaeon]NKQ38270.1 ATP-binding cassette domain-containing protein [Methanosarcinales archaeon]
MNKTTKSLIQVENLHFKYTGRKIAALSGVNVEISEGETVLLLGSSGSGKSTLALSFNGLIPQKISGKMSGSVFISKMNTKETYISSLTQEVGILFQDPESQFVTMTVEDEITFGLENLCIHRQKMDNLIDDALKQVGMLHCRHRQLDELSGGEKQRLAIACLLAMQPKILIFDEPTANLDPIGTQQVFETIAKLKQTGKFTIIIIEHKLDELMDLIDRVLVLSAKGTVVYDGSPEVIFNDKVSDLLQYGVWIPQTVCLAHKIRLFGVEIPSLPLTITQAEQTLKKVLPHINKNSFNFCCDDCDGKPSIIEVRNLSFKYNQKTIIRDVNLNIIEGDFLALVGPNGAGKTTLAQLLMGILRQQKGKILLNNMDISKIAYKELIKQVGFVFQNPEHQIITDSVEHEVSYGLQVMGLAEDEIKTRTDYLLTKFGLKQLAKANPFTLSHGEKRRLSVATMLAVGQKILILDEPTFGQDQRNADNLMQMLKSLHGEGCTVIMVTHDMALVAEYAKHVAVMIDGQIYFYGTVKEVFTQPELLAKANLTLPPIAELSRCLTEKNTDWPEFFTISQFLELLKTVPYLDKGITQ